MTSRDRLYSCSWKKFSRLLLCALCMEFVCLPLLVVEQEPVVWASETQTESYERLAQRIQEIERELQHLRDSAENQPVTDQVIQASLNLPSQNPAEHYSGNLPPPLVREPPKTYPTVVVSGFFQLDSAFFNQSETNSQTVGDADDGADFRRARLMARGDVADNVGYLIEFDFGFAGRPSFMDVWTEIREIPFFGNIRVGHFRQPSGMDIMTSAREFTFIEPALPFMMTPIRQVGVGFHNHDNETGTTWAASVFRFPTDPFGGNLGDSGGYSMASRITTLLFEDPANHSLFHIGADYTLINPSNGLSRFRSTPEIFLAEQPGATVAQNSIPVFVDTLPIPTNLYHMFNLETGMRWGTISGQAEWRLAHIEQDGGPALDFQSAYGELRWGMTGEIRNYRRDQGVFGRVDPLHPFKVGCGWGAFETAARVSWLDLDDKNVTGNQMTNLTLGLNWYLNNNTKFQFNFIHSMLGGDAIPNSTANIVAARAQLDF